MQSINAYKRLEASILRGHDLPPGDGGPADFTDVMRMLYALSVVDPVAAELESPGMLRAGSSWLWYCGRWRGGWCCCPPCSSYPSCHMHRQGAIVRVFPSPPVLRMRASTPTWPRCAGLAAAACEVLPGIIEASQQQQSIYQESAAGSPRPVFASSQRRAIREAGAGAGAKRAPAAGSGGGGRRQRQGGRDTPPAGGERQQQRGERGWSQ